MHAFQADVEVTFSFGSLDKVEAFDTKWVEYDAQKICSLRGSFVEGGLGPFGLLTLASENLEEYTPVFFRVFKAQDKHKVLMCSDASRSRLCLYYIQFMPYLLYTKLLDSYFSLHQDFDLTFFFFFF